MKFLALALALLLAIGSHAASLQADEAPSQLDHIRAAVGIYLSQVKESATKALDHLDDTEYKDYKLQLSTSLDNLQTQLQSMQAAAAPYTNIYVGQIMEATAAIRASVMADVNALHAELQPKSVALREVIDKHIAEYRAQLDPIISEYAAKHRAEMDALKIKLDPVVEELKSKIATNVEETKAALMPMVELVRGKLTERLEGLKELAAPYVEEYKEQFAKALAEVKEKAGALNAADLQSQLAPHITALKDKAGPLAEDAKAKLAALYETIAAALSKN